MGPKPTPNHSIERKNTDGNYEPSNCYWATDAEQSRNTSRNKLIAFNGVTLCVTDWAQRLGLATNALKYRLRNWPLEDALTIPAKQSHRPRRCRLVTFCGVTQPISEWTKVTGISTGVIRSRLDAGWSPERTLTTLPRPMRH